MKKFVALYCRDDSSYKKREHWDVYDKYRDAASFNGTQPVVAHPPCRAWSMMQHASFRSEPNPHYSRCKEMHLALHAAEIVFTNGGIIEHPLHSRIWNLGIFNYAGMTLNIDQYDFGHIAHKPTTLYIYPRIKLPPYPMPNIKKAQYSVFGSVKGTKDAKSYGPGKNYGREYTPEKLIDWFEIILTRISDTLKCASEASKPTV